jgi:hypothetical protein
MSVITIIVNTPGDRATILERRDEIIAHLTKIGLRLSMTSDGTDVYMVDGSIPTIGEALTAAAEAADGMAAGDSALAAYEHVAGGDEPGSTISEAVDALGGDLCGEEAYHMRLPQPVWPST